MLAYSSTGEDSPDTTLEISKSSTKISYTYEDEKVKVSIETQTDTFLNETAEPFDAVDTQCILKLEEKAAKMVESNVKRVIEKVQKDYNSDIFGFGSMIYKSNPSLWRQLSDHWDEIFPSIQVDVHSKVNIVNSSYIKKS